MTKYDHLVTWSHPGKQWFWKVTHTVLSHSGVGQSDRITSKLASWPISPKWPFWGCPIWGTPDEILGFHVPAYGIRDVRSGVPQTRSWDFMSLRMESGMSDLGYPRRDPGISCPCVWNPGCPIWDTPAGILGFHVPAYGIRDVRSGTPSRIIPDRTPSRIIPAGTLSRIIDIHDISIYHEYTYKSP
jgi:hypothetical protein